MILVSPKNIFYIVIGRLSRLVVEGNSSIISKIRQHLTIGLLNQITNHLIRVSSQFFSSFIDCDPQRITEAVTGGRNAEVVLLVHGVVQDEVTRRKNMCLD